MGIGRHGIAVELDAVGLGTADDTLLIGDGQAPEGVEMVDSALGQHERAALAGASPATSAAARDASCFGLAVPSTKPVELRGHSIYFGK